MSVTQGTTASFFWVETGDHDEDWLVVARTSRSASGFFEDCEGYNRGDARASRVISGLAIEEGDEVPRYARFDDLKALGLIILRIRPDHVARLVGRFYHEGKLEGLIESIQTAMEANKSRSNDSMDSG